jgi:Fur family ferric uptake transcriptional regulator
MSNSDDLKSMGLKATIPRLKILALFEKSDVRHLTAEDVYRLLLAENLDVGLATVYRVLTQFEQAGLLERHYFESASQPRPRARRSRRNRVCVAHLRSMVVAPHG